jgi:uncharacterized protein YabN with tetrapyrrole methylase and pyrophosphatase domain
MKGDVSRRRLREPVADALQLQNGAARQGFDWRRAEELWDKLAEEIAELHAARTARERKDELGDLFFMLINLARHLKVDPRQALAAANRKFRRRYGHIQKHWNELPPLKDPRRLDAMEALWQEAKRKEKDPLPQPFSRKRARGVQPGSR